MLGNSSECPALMRIQGFLPSLSVALIGVHCSRGGFAQGCNQISWIGPGEVNIPFMSWKHAHFQICLKGKGNFLPAAYSVSKHPRKAPFSSFIAGHFEDGRN